MTNLLLRESHQLLGHFCTMSIHVHIMHGEICMMYIHMYMCMYMHIPTMKLSVQCTCMCASQGNATLQAFRDKTEGNTPVIHWRNSHAIAESTRLHYYSTLNTFIPILSCSRTYTGICTVRYIAPPLAGEYSLLTSPRGLFASSCLSRLEHLLCFWKPAASQETFCRLLYVLEGCGLQEDTENILPAINQHANVQSTQRLANDKYKLDTRFQDWKNVHGSILVYRDPYIQPCTCEIRARKLGQVHRYIIHMYMYVLHVRHSHVILPWITGR